MDQQLLSATILLIDADDTARTALADALAREGMRAVEVAGQADGLRALYYERPDLVILDVAPLRRHGLRTLERLREVADVPVIVVSTTDDETAKVRALRAGADDYLTKPVGAGELVARCEAVLRRASSNDHARPRGYRDALVTIDPTTIEATAAGRSLCLTPLEFRLLSVLTAHPNQVLSAEDLLRLAWGDPGSGRTRVKVYVGYLRSKFRALGVDPAPIETVRGFGYRYRPA